GDTKNWILKPENEWVIVQSPPIITEETYNQVQAIFAQQELKSKRTGKKAVYLLSGYLKCECSKTMYVVKSTQTYYCQHCRTKITVADIDEIYQEYLAEYLHSFNATDFLSNSNSVLIQKNELLNKTMQDRKKLSKKFETYLEMRSNGELSKEQFAEHSQPLNIRITQLDDSIPELQAEVDFLAIQMASTDVVLDEAKQLSNKWAEMPIEEKRAIVETITDSIVIRKEDIDIALCFLPSSSEKQIISNASMELCGLLFFKQKTVSRSKKGYPHKPTTIGEHIRKKRMDIGMYQWEVAKQLHVSEETITNWEINRTIPQIKYYPRITSFLGYEFWKLDRNTISGKLKAYRYTNGLSVKRCAKLIQVDPSTIDAWESGKNASPQDFFEKLNTVLKTLKPLE
ncbi:MAG: hypothetical protein K2X69_15310, partial [Silvanigrellaceae bacterium]|nr:hypothetical protein [Silvanigrellaceae bacterium]